MSLYFEHEFEATIRYHDVGSARYRYTVVFLPDALKAVLPLETHPRLRISGEVDDHPLEASLTPVRGEWYVLLSKKLLKGIDAVVGDTVTVRFRIADQDAVEVPVLLRDALARDQTMRALWEASTSGKQRALAYRVASAKRAPTQEKRIQEVFAILRGDLDMRGKPLSPEG
ncbi:MAG: YdeI/OmpD-associated family protein [Pseudomonadota bacterium]